MASALCSVLTKRKIAALENDYESMLTLVIGGVEDLDSDPSGYGRTYSLIGWVVEPSNWFQTWEVSGFPNPVWNSQYRFILDKSMNLDYVYMELYRTRTSSGEGPSSGNVLVGRAKISLPKIDLKDDEQVDSKKCGLFWLVMPKGSGCSSEGKIAVKMELKKVRMHGYHY